MIYTEEILKIVREGSCFYMAIKYVIGLHAHTHTNRHRKTDLPTKSSVGVNLLKVYQPACQAKLVTLIQRVEE